MKGVVVYESLYGNTREIAEAVAAGLAEGAEVELVPVADASSAAIDGADLLVVGGPTHVHGMVSGLSRKGAVNDAAKKGRPEPEIEGPPLRDWLSDLGAMQGRAAAFDTRLPQPKALTGSAARGIAKRLRHHGFEVVGEESFIVEDAVGPLRNGELDRAREWGRTLAAAR